MYSVWRHNDCAAMNWFNRVTVCRQQHRGVIVVLSRGEITIMEQLSMPPLIVALQPGAYHDVPEIHWVCGYQEMGGGDPKDTHGYFIAFLLISLWCNFSVKPSLSLSAAQSDQSHGLIWFNPKLIRQRQHEGGVPICAPLCPPAQRWQMCPPQWKYWELLGHLSGNIWAIWKITFCKWTQIKMYAVPFPCAGSVSAAPHKYYHDIMFPVLVQLVVHIYWLHKAHTLLGLYSQSWTYCRSNVHKNMLLSSGHLPSITFTGQHDSSIRCFQW